MKIEISGVIPVMAVYTSDWQFLGHVRDAGTKISERLARTQFQIPRVRLVPALVELE